MPASPTAPPAERPRKAFRRNGFWPGWGRTRGLFRPRIEIGALGCRLQGGHLGALLAHERCHQVEHHRLKIVVVMALAFGLSVLVAWVLPVPLAGFVVLGPLCGVLYAGALGLKVLRLFEQRADAQAAHLMGWLWFQVLDRLIYVEPSALDLLVHGTRAQRLGRVADVAKASSNAGYGPKGAHGPREKW